jgi:uncharacterized RDD family membrane protein YckC
LCLAWLWLLAFFDDLTTTPGLIPGPTTGLMTTASTNCPAGGDPAAHAHLCSAAAEPAASEPNLCLTPDPNSDPNSDPNPDSWRVEVAARLERYRTRRKPRTPRYPSLLLPFDAPESWSRSAAASGSAALAAAPAGQNFTFPTKEEPLAVETPGFQQPRQASKRDTSNQGPYQYPEQPQEPSANVIEFPRSAAIPVFRPSDLADPVFDRDRPRIVEVPEILPPPPALGGMLIEPADQERDDKRAADFPAASPSASLGRRALAALVDGVILAMALAAVAGIFLRLNVDLIHGLISVHGPLPILAGAFAVIAVLLWASYEFLFVVYTGSTPGLRATRLRLAAFDGSPLSRRSRRWRVLASFLSAFSAGLGYLWCVLDQEGLCWHDRITRTHVQSAKQAE